MKYNVGDKVRIKIKPKFVKIIKGTHLFDERSLYNGCIATIGKIGENDGEYFINGLGNKDWIWEEDDFDETYTCKTENPLYDLFCEQVEELIKQQIKIDKMKSKKVKITLPKNCEVDKVETSVEDGYLVVEYTPKKEEGLRKIPKDKFFIPKDGDILSDGKFILLYKETHVSGGIRCYCYLYNDSKFEILKGDGHGCGYICKYHLADKDERASLLNAIKAHGYTFNKETKKLEKIRWIPKGGDTYFYITDFFHINKRSFNNDSIDWAFFHKNNCFQTKEETQEYANKIKELLKNRP